MSTLPSTFFPVRRFFGVSIALAVSLSLTGCGPERGSPEWCKQMGGKPQSQWSPDDGQEYVSKCVLEPGLKDIPMPGRR